MTRELPLLAVDTSRPVAMLDMYVTATVDGDRLTAYVSVRCDDTDSWMLPLAVFLAKHPHTVEHSERLTDPTMVGGEAVYTVYRIG